MTIDKEIHFSRSFALVVILLLLSACVPNNGGSKAGNRKPSSLTVKIPKTNGAGNSSGPTNINLGTSATVVTSGVELRHLVDPLDGTYSRKVTLPKNFNGYLYLSGLNVASMANKLVSVRFNFGQAMEPVTIPATISRGPGIIPQTDIEVLILDMADKPFEKIRLLYDLYDYNNYGTNFSDKNPVSSNRDRNLFCRGVDLQYDPTFTATTSVSTCSGATSVCKYTYAKVADQGLLDVNSVPAVPSNSQVALGSTGVYSADTNAQKLTKCMPEDGTVPFVIAGYTYAGPYRFLNTPLWQISSQALTGTDNGLSVGLFETSSAGIYLKSLLFPRYGQLPLRKNIEHIGRSTSNTTPVNGAKSLQSMLSSDGTTGWMDGCNIRVANYDSFVNEGIGSCNVTSTVQIIYTNPSTGKEEVLAESKDVKLQLVRDSALNSIGQDVLYTAMRTCSNSNMCGGNECCYNSRCWSKDLVSQCVEDSQSEGNLPVGDVCTSDYQCTSLCCNASIGRCAVHDNQQNPPVYCSKSAGETCVAREWCRKEPVVNCYNVSTGTNAQGVATCALRCYNSLQFGDCKNGTCSPPPAGVVDAFVDCSNARAASSFTPNGTLISTTTSGSGSGSGTGTTGN